LVIRDISSTPGPSSECIK